MNAALERVLGAFRTVKACGAESREGARVHAAAAEAWRASLRADRWQALVGNTTELAIQFAFLAVVATGGAQVASGTISVGTLVAFLLYVLFLMGPVSQLTNAVSQYQIGAAAVTRIEEAGQLPAEPPDTGRYRGVECHLPARARARARAGERQQGDQQAQAQYRGVNEPFELEPLLTGRPPVPDEQARRGQQQAHAPEDPAAAGERTGRRDVNPARMPVGLGTLGSPCTAMVPGSSQVRTTEIAPSPAAAQPTTHHRAVRGRPSGNNSSRNSSRPPGNSSVSDQPSNHAAHTAAGGWEGPASACSAYSPASARAAVTVPRLSKNQPMGLDCLRYASTAPTTG